jgi:hypothetical protein
MSFLLQEVIGEIMGRQRGNLRESGSGERTGHNRLLQPPPPLSIISMLIGKKAHYSSYFDSKLSIKVI